MTTAELSDVLARVAGRILEDAAFIFTDRMSADDRPQPGMWSAEGVAVSYSGKASGTVHLWAGQTFACIAASNMLGLDCGAPDVSAKGLDALKELLNIIVGNFLTETYGGEPLFNMGLPVKLDIRELRNDFSSPNAVWLEAEGNAVMFTVRIDA